MNKAKELNNVNGGGVKNTSPIHWGRIICGHCRYLA